MAQALACGKCGNLIASDRIKLDFDGNCPWCLAAFALGDAPQDDLPSLPPIPCVKASDRLGKYLLTEKLGTGGMGEVWKALDTELNRWVALKFLRDQDPRELARFAREAQMTAKLSHPNIAAVHEIGEAGGRHYIAMQCIQGRTLETFPTNDRRLLVRLFLDAAWALHHAHRHRVIHRDVKPGNLMVEETEEGIKVVVLDFGLARSIEGGEKLSMSGSVVGTPQYLSPEQARGEKLDERTDVYSLGATMYEIFTGKAPFEGQSVYEILKKIENESPIAPRMIKPQINQDLQTIILKCLEKDRERRYPGAKELAYDLRRYLNHEAVLARPPSAIYRLRMKLAKRKAVVATAAVASLALAAGLGWWLLVGGPGAEHHRMMAAGMRLWDEARVSAMTGGDPADIREKARAAREGFERAIQSRDESEAQMMRGRCLELEGRDKEALKAMERAYELNPGNAEARVEFAKAIFLNYQASRGISAVVFRRRQGASRGVPKIQDLPRETNEETRLRQRGEKLLAEGKVGPAQENLLNGLLAMGKGEYSQAARELAVYTKAARWDAQALRLEGLCRYFDRDYLGALAALDHALSRVPHPLGFTWRGLVRSATGSHDEAIADYSRSIALDPKCGEAYLNRGNAKSDKGLHDEAIADYDEAIEVHPKWEAAFLNRGGAKKDKGLHDQAIADYDQVITLDPKNADAYAYRGIAKMDKGVPGEAIADYDRAIKLDPEHAQAYLNRGALKCDLGLHDEAIADCDKVITLDPNDAKAYYNRGLAKAGKGLHDDAIADYVEAIKRDPKFAEPYSSRATAKAEKGLLDDAIADYDTAIKLDPKLAEAHANRGNVKGRKGLHIESIADYDAAIKLDPKEAEYYSSRGYQKKHMGLYDEAIADYGEAIRVDPKYAAAYSNRGALKCDVKRLYDEAIADFDRVIALEPKGAAGYSNRGNAKKGKGLLDEAIADYCEAIRLDLGFSNAYSHRGLAKESKGLHDEAIADCTKAIELDPKSANAFNNRGMARAAKGLLDSAIADYDEAIRLDPKLAAAYSNRGNVKSSQGFKDAAIADYDMAIKLDPKFANAYSSRGNAKIAKGLHDEGIEDHDQAIRLDPTHAAAYSNRGVAKDAKGLHDEAIADYDKAIQLNPTFAPAYSNRGAAKNAKGLHDAAIADFDEAIRLDPTFAAAFTSRGNAKSAKGLKDAAIVDYTEAITLAPNDEDAYAYRGNAMLAKGQYDEAIDDYTAAINLAPDYEDAYANRAMAKSRKGLLEEAIADYKRALEVAPAGWSYRTEIERRIAEIDSPDARDPKFKAAWESYGRSSTLLSEKKYAGAIEAFRKIVAEFPKKQIGVDSAYSIACGYALLGEKKNALDWLEKAVEMGWKNVAHLEKDSDLESLRDEVRYKKLTGKLKAR